MTSHNPIEQHTWRTTSINTIEISVSDGTSAYWPLSDSMTWIRRTDETSPSPERNSLAAQLHARAQIVPAAVALPDGRAVHVLEGTVWCAPVAAHGVNQVGRWSPAAEIAGSTPPVAELGESQSARYALPVEIARSCAPIAELDEDPVPMALDAELGMSARNAHPELGQVRHGISLDAGPHLAPSGASMNINNSLVPSENDYIEAANGSDEIEQFVSAAEYDDKTRKVHQYWLHKLGKWLGYTLTQNAHHDAYRRGIRSPEQCRLAAFPNGYKLFIHMKGNKCHPRKDAYLYGFAEKRPFRSPSEFYCHLEWLVFGQRRLCECRYCTVVDGQPSPQLPITQAIQARIPLARPAQSSSQNREAGLSRAIREARRATMASEQSRLQLAGSEAIQPLIPLGRSAVPSSPVQAAAGQPGAIEAQRTTLTNDQPRLQYPSAEAVQAQIRLSPSPASSSRVHAATGPTGVTHAPQRTAPGGSGRVGGGSAWGHRTTAQRRNTSSLMNQARRSYANSSRHRNFAMKGKNVETRMGRGPDFE